MKVDYDFMEYMAWHHLKMVEFWSKKLYAPEQDKLAFECQQASNRIGVMAFEQRAIAKAKMENNDV